MIPYDFWKTTDIEGERRAEAGEWIDTRADDDPDFLLRVSEDDILKSGYEANLRPVVELVADIIALHEMPPDRLPGSVLLTRLYQHARQLHQQARTAASEQAEREIDTLPLGRIRPLPPS